MEAREQIINLLQTMGGEQINVCGEIYEILRSGGDQGGELLRFFCESAEGIKSSKESEARQWFTEGEVLDFTRSYGKIVDGFLEKLFTEKLDKEKFYEELWGKITLKELFEDEKAQIFALYRIWMDVRIPYFELPATIRLEESEYLSIIDKLRSKIQEARFILFSDFKQWTEVSYLLLKLMEDMDNVNEKTVFLACIMQIRDRMVVQSRMQKMAEETGEQGN